LTLSSFEVDPETLGLLDDRIRSELRSASGRWLVARGRAYRDQSGQVERILGVLHDISEQKHAERERELFLGALGHDLRNPLNASVESSGDEVALQVENAGPTIPDDMKLRIFEPFVSSAGGVGLGLYVANQLVRAHRGRIELVSANAKTVFRAVLPKTALQPS